MHLLQKIAGFWFLLLGLLMVAAYVLLRGELLGPWPAYTLQYGDLPFLLSALVYGGSSLVLSLRGTKGTSPVLSAIISTLVVALFGAVCVMNFWVK